MRTLACRFLGRVPYADAAALQERLVAARRGGAIGDTLLLLEHAPVVTLGRSADPAHVLLSPQALAARGIALHESGRGGDVTFHGPGQLVGYPIVALCGAERDAHRYLRRLEDALLATAAAFGVDAARRPGLTGIWRGDAKLAAIGVRIGTGWITSHGFALNVADDLEGFETIVPCGIEGAGVTSLERLASRRLELRDVAEVASLEVARALDAELLWEAEAGTLSSRPEGARA